MAPSKFRKAIGAVKDQTSISIAKVSSSTSMSDLEVAILKATRHDEYPAEDKHIMEILSLTSYSKAFISSCVNLISKRLNKTKNWTVALKTLMLVHRLLIEGDPSYEQEMFFATRRGTRLLNMSDFRDKSQSGSWDFSAFVRTYALYLDEQLEYRMHGRKRRSSKQRSTSMGGDQGSDYDHEEDRHYYHHQIVVVTSTASSSGGTNSVRQTPVRDMKTERIFTRAQHLLQLLERFLACRPTGVAKANRVVLVALYPIVRESFQLYYDITEIMGVLIDRFMEMEIPDCVKVHEIFARIAKQFDELDLFYNWCKSVGIARSSEYPEVEKIPLKKLDLMDEFIREKSALEHKKTSYMSQQEQKLELTYKEEDQEQEKFVEDEEDANEIKALPPPEGFSTDEPEDQEKDKINNNTQQEADLLNLGEDAMTREEHGDRLALAVFEGDASTTATNDEGQDNQKWVAFTSGDSSDWEAALVQSASHLNKQKLSLAGGFDMLLLDGMYKQPLVNYTAPASNGSSSSFALGSAGAPTMLALPAPPVPGNGTSSSATAAGTDPFAASLAVAPPAYVQMSEMEKKQRLLVEEQVMWQQYARDGMKGHLGMPQNSYGMGGYNSSYS